MASADSDEILVILAETPQRTGSLTTGFNQICLHTRTINEPWAVNDILAHLRACADVWGESIQAMLQQNQPTLRHISPRSWIRNTDYPDLDFQPSFMAFCKQREVLLKILSDLEPAAWQRGAVITGMTKIRT